MAYFRASLGGGKDYAAGQGLDITNDILSLKTASSSQQGGAVIDGTSITLNSNNQIKALLDQTVTLSDNTSTISVGSTDVITASTDGGGTLSVSTSDSTVATAVISNGEITIIGVGAGNCTITVNASASGNYGSASAVISVTIEAIHVYGAEWDGSSDASWTRTDDAALFTDPNPYYAGMSGIPSSPFDNLMPWSGMRIVEDDNAGTLVEIPKFWYKWTRNGSTMKLQISDGEQTDEGWHVSPAHQDRSDGVGERDYVYIGRYHCSGNSTSYYKSKSGVTPYSSLTKAEFRTGIHNLGTIIWQNDFAMWWTVRMLYLVEIAHWNSQAKIGYGCGSGSSTGNMGYTDLMSYHTGTTAASRQNYGLGTQYRYIEGLWDNVLDIIDGIYLSDNNIYCILNPSNFSDYSNGVALGSTTFNVGIITSWHDPSVYLKSGYEYALFPRSVSNADSGNYICDQYYAGTTGYAAIASGGNYLSAGSNYYGLFYLRGFQYYTTDVLYGSRLMVLPPTRLSPPSP